MATNDTILNESAAEIIGGQISKRFSGIYHRLSWKPKTVALTESFDIWHLSTRNLREAIRKGRFPAYKTRYLHHQIRLGRSAKAFAISRKSSSNPPRVFKVSLSRTAERIDDAIGRLDSEVNDDTQARLLVVRPFFIYAFWLVKRQQVYLISVPFRFRRLRSEKYLSTTDFLNILKEEIKPFNRKKKKHRW